ncbi:unnamed protein product [Effrenium voratum]|uniref:EF-hand domain-containing protein n=1 Tax=Effrenium voratum TaxID=2562239 RepID=A0AA36INU1_9DINO|nr:unnamed protein product [Effrenium voratum]CAJ1424648.1 unnamed protein product [Effrenium voratum]
MGNLPFCDLCQGEVRDGLDAVIRDMIIRLFELYDLNGDGVISAEEMYKVDLAALAGHMDTVREEYKQQVWRRVEMKFCQMHGDLTPVHLSMYKAYMDRWLKEMEPSDRNARFLILEGVLIEARSGRQMVEEERCAALPTLLTSIPQPQTGAEYSPSRKVAGRPLAG